LGRQRQGTESATKYGSPKGGKYTKQKELAIGDTSSLRKRPVVLPGRLFRVVSRSNTPGGGATYKMGKLGAQMRLRMAGAWQQVNAIEPVPGGSQPPPDRPLNQTGFWQNSLINWRY